MKGTHTETIKISYIDLNDLTRLLVSWSEHKKYTIKSLSLMPYQQNVFEVELERVFYSDNGVFDYDKMTVLTGWKL